MPKSKVQTQFKNSTQASFIARQIADSFNRGSAIEARIETVLNHLREDIGVRSLKKLDINTVNAFVDTMRDKLESGELLRPTVSNYISALNDVVKYVNENLNRNLETVSAREMGLSKGGVQYQNRVVSEQTHQAFKEYLKSQNDIRAQALSQSLELQRQFGLRLRESISIKCETIQQALQTGQLQLSRQDGTKNSQPRSIPIITQEQRQAIRNILEFMRSYNLKSLTPTHTRLEQYHYAQNVKTKFNRINSIKMDYHGERHYFAQFMLHQGYPEQKISEMLGHHREEILKYYSLS